ncbi:MAG: hypothetical protein J6T65_10050, partial [Clostridia bacterium]|nr:hypothetical protein [Clostridia bacterium]
MKKILALVTVIVMIAAMCIISNAEYTFSDAAPTFDSAAIIDVPSDLDKVSGYNGTIGTDLHNLSSGGNGYCPKGNTCV